MIITKKEISFELNAKEIVLLKKACGAISEWNRYRNKNFENCLGTWGINADDELNELMIFIYELIEELSY